MIHHEADYAITNALVASPDGLLFDTTIVVRGGVISSIGPYDASLLQGLAIFDAKANLVGPGLIDMHIHGCGGFDPTQGDVQASLEGMASFLAERGITAFQLATVMDMDVLNAVRQALQASPFLSSHLLGVYTEGPFIAQEKRGGIFPSSIKAYDRAYLDSILALSYANSPLVSTMTIAPELEGSEELSAVLEEHGVVVAYGHSNALLSHLQVRPKHHLTHLFNAMSPIDHKNPGLATLPFVRAYSHATYELVCDGVHVHPSVVELTLNTLGTSRLCIVSDGMNLAGLGACEGLYAGKAIYSNGKACYFKENDLLIGSATLIVETARNLYHQGLLDKLSFFKVTSENPGRVLTLSDRGRVQVGYRADLVLLSDTMDVLDVFTAG